MEANNNSLGQKEWKPQNANSTLTLIRCCSCCSCYCSCLSDLFKESIRPLRFKSDRDEIWQECSSSKIMHIDRQSRIIDLTSHFQDGRWKPSAATGWVNTKRLSEPMLQRTSVPDIFVLELPTDHRGTKIGLLLFITERVRYRVAYRYRETKKNLMHQ